MDDDRKLLCYVYASMEDGHKLSFRFKCNRQKRCRYSKHDAAGKCVDMTRKGACLNYWSRRAGLIELRNQLEMVIYELEFGR